ncbi:MAG: stage V sporulation protein AD [Christensenellaceae bacterium]|nr:stage V sporulation protein AD [Christensenellaceae bacterium]
MGIIGKHSYRLENTPHIVSSACYVGDKEGKGPMREYFDKICKDDTLGLDSWEQAESRMFESAVRVALAKIGKQSDDLSCLLGGDLLNQIISAGYAAREIRAPFLGLYGACSTISEGLLVGGMLVDGGFLDLAACAASSHFSSAERQYRYPLEMGVQAVPTSQRTVTGAGSIIIKNSASMNDETDWFFKHIVITGGTIGSVEDYGITDANNMGAAMAPAASETICTHFRDYSSSPDDYDCIITGDLGNFGSDMLYELCKKEGYDIKEKHEDCGKMMFSEDQNVNCGASGCGCAATIVSGYFLPQIERGVYNKVLFLATGALLSPVSSLQGESIPSIAHAVVLEHV